MLSSPNRHADSPIAVPDDQRRYIIGSLGESIDLGSRLHLALAPAAARRGALATVSGARSRARRCCQRDERSDAPARLIDAVTQGDENRRIAFHATRAIREVEFYGESRRPPRERATVGAGQHERIVHRLARRLLRRVGIA
jgi:hypothetical protein